MTKILTLTDALEALDELEASAIGDEPYNHFGAEIVRRYIEQEFSLKINKEQAEQEPEYKGWYCAHCERGVDGSEVTFHEQHEVCGRVITDDVPPKPVKQEPVAEIIGFERTNDIRGVKRIPRIKWNVPLWEDESPLQLGNLYAAPQPVKQEPVAWKDLTYGNLHHQDFGNSIPLYAAPVSAKREWVDLTDDEIGAVMDFGYATDSELENARAVITAFKEKNK